VFVICFGVASITYIFAGRPDDQHTKEFRDLKDQVEALRAEAQVVKGQLAGLSGRPPVPGLRESVVNWHHAVDPASEDVQAILLDPSLSELDKITLLNMLTMKAIDRDIEHQVQLVNSIQYSPSVDVETMKLKRMIDKRSQIFDMLRQQIDQYNKTAKAIIDSMR